MIKRLLRYITLIVVGLIALLCGYYTVEIIKARAHTRSVVMKQLQSEAIVLDLEDITKRQLDILLKVEDPSFYDHNGVDLSTPGAGITTITQGLVKKFYFKKFKPGPAKIKQTLIAMFVLDPLVSKDDQLRLFINTCHFGNINGQEVKGFEAAAQAFYDKPFQKLSEDEYISLVAMIIAPATFHVQRHPERNAGRVTRIKRVVSGEYTPKGLFDLYYGPMPEDVQNKLPPTSYFEKYYQ
jgi:membrane carboxypeptidase/penicillin-binding protein